MNTDVNSLPNDPEILKALLLKIQQQHQEVVEQYEQTIEQQRRQLSAQEHRIAQLLRRIYGSRQERIDPKQLMLFSLDELEALAKELEQDVSVEAWENEDAPNDKPRKRRGKRSREFPANAKREQRIYELNEQERACPCCGEQRQEFGRDSSYQMDLIPAQLIVIEHVRVKYVCSHCEGNIAQAPKPPQPIEKSMAGPGLLAHLVLSKYGDHLPLYRLEDIYLRLGGLIRRSTLCEWTAEVSDLLQPLWNRMGELVLMSRVIFTDDTHVKMLIGSGKAATARFWAYLGDESHPYIVYDFTTSRERDGPTKFLVGYEGYLQADAYSVYDGIYLESQGRIQEVACWAHARRYWWEAKATDSRRSHAALSYIGRLYQIERESSDAGLCGDALRDARQRHAVPILNEFRQWIDREEPQVLPKSPIGEAMRYTMNQWGALVRYTEQGYLSIDNNASERAVKLAAIGRKNWLFVASPRGGERAARLFTFTASCKVNQVEPYAYLRDILEELPKRLAANPELRTNPGDSLDDLLPDRWLAAHPEHRWEIDEIRRQERQNRPRR